MSDLAYVVVCIGACLYGYVSELEYECGCARALAYATK